MYIKKFIVEIEYGFLIILMSLFYWSVNYMKDSYDIIIYTVCRKSTAFM